jgi:CubicO group peptidase (beta-lactamase class C family)
MAAWGLVLLLAAGFVSAAAETPSPSLEQRIDTHLGPYLEIDHLSGTVLIARDTKVVYEKSFGFANHEVQVPNTPATLFCIGSINKPLTIVILARMIEAKQLALSDKLSKFLPDFPRGDDITIDDLLNHSAGIPHRVTEPIDETRPQTAASMVELAAAKALVFEPGSDSVYSSAGFSVLARVLELVSGRPYAELLTEYVLEPAGMQSTFDVGSRVVLKGRAASYAFDTDGLLNAPPQDVSYLVGAGSVYSTPRDLLAFQRALLAGTYGELAKEWLVRENGDLGSNGLAAGFRAFADYDAESGISVIVASNLVSGALDRIRNALPDIAAGRDVETPLPIDAKAAQVEPKLLQNYVGDYELRPGRNLELRIIDGRVRMGDWLLIPTSNTTLFSPQDYAVISVISDEAGAVERLDWTTGGNTYPMPKVKTTNAE